MSKDYRISFKLECVKPLLMNFVPRDGMQPIPEVWAPPLPFSENARTLREKALKKVPEGAVVLSEDQEQFRRELRQLAAARVYRHGTPSDDVPLEDLNVGVPVSVLEASLRTAARGVDVGKMALGTRQSTRLPGFLRLKGEFYPFRHGTPWEPHMLFLANKTTRMRKGDYRVDVLAKFATWEIYGTAVAHCHQGFTLGHARTIFDTAGATCGIGGMRGDRKGYVNFGSFRVTEWSATEIARTQPTFHEIARDCTAA